MGQLKSINSLKDVRNRGKKNKHMSCLFAWVLEGLARGIVTFLLVLLWLSWKWMCVCLNVWEGHREWQTGFLVVLTLRMIVVVNVSPKLIALKPESQNVLQVWVKTVFYVQYIMVHSWMICIHLFSFYLNSFFVFALH